MKTIALWAINGIGIGHTSRISLVAKELKRNNVRVKFLVEHPPQENYLRKEGHIEPILVIPRPWKLPLDQKYSVEVTIKKYLSDICGFIGDMGSVPEKENINYLIPKYVKPVFLLRWISKERWTPIAKRIKNFRDAEVVIVSPKRFFEKLTEIEINSIPGIEKRIHFINGFIFHEPISMKKQVSIVKPKIAFCCGSGGIHSMKGFTELEEVINGLYLTKKLLGKKILLDAWIGNNNRLRKIASQYNIFEQIGGLDSNIMPCWNNYDFVLGRCGYNTFLEVMSSRAVFITGSFESDGEWTKKNLEKLAGYGVICLPELKSGDIFSVLSTIFSSSRINKEYITESRDIFKNDLESLFSTFKEIITSQKNLKGDFYHD